MVHKDKENYITQLRKILVLNKSIYYGPPLEESQSYKYEIVGFFSERRECNRYMGVISVNWRKHLGSSEDEVNA